MNASSAISPLTRQLANAIGECCGEKKLQPYDLQQADFIRWLKDHRSLSANELRNVRTHLSRVGGFVQVRNAFFVGAPTASVLEKVETQGIAKLGKTNVVALAHDELFIARFREVMTEVMKNAAKLAPYGCSTKTVKGHTDRAVTLALSDLHFGSKLDPRELPYRYDFVDESRALASVIVRLCDFKKDYREHTELFIWIGGDLTRGKIHDKQAGRAGAEQAADAMWLLTQAIRVAAGHFKKVTVYCSTGNHDRDESRHEGVAFEQKWDSRATVVYFGIKLAVSHIPNVQVIIPRTPHCEWEVFGHRFYATHGDTNFRVGNPSKLIDIRNMDQQMTNINLAQFQRGQRPYNAFIAGHVHQGLHLPLPSGDLVVNPALMPPDGYATGIGYVQQRSGQVMFETTAKHVVGDLRFFFVDADTSKDKALDKVIEPFKDF